MVTLLFKPVSHPLLNSLPITMIATTIMIMIEIRQMEVVENDDEYVDDIDSNNGDNVDLDIEHDR